MTMSPRRLVACFFATLAVAAVGGCSGGASASDRVSCPDVLTSDAVSDLTSFVSWLEKNDVHGAVGEVGWPAASDGNKWSSLASQWDAVARQAKLPVLVWAVSEWLPPSYTLRAATPATSSAGTLTALNPQLDLLLSANQKNQNVGVDDIGGEFGTPANFSNTTPGAYGTAWHFDNLQTLQFIAAQGIKVVRVPIRWERFEPALGGPLDPSAVARLKTYLENAQTAGLSVILDVHNFGEYLEGTAGSSAVTTLNLGSPQLPDSTFAAFWTDLVQTFGGYSAIGGWDLMNEPTALPATDGSQARTWEIASQDAVTAIRQAGDKHTVWVEGYNYAATGSFRTLTPKAWIKDPANAVIYEAHAYFDQDRSGEYDGSYSVQQAKALTAAHGSAPAEVCLPND
jgi:hypothetical protein